MTDKTAETGPETGLKPRDQAAPATRAGETAKAHTELRVAGQPPKPRSRVVPTDSDEDDLFNDMPV